MFALLCDPGMIVPRTAKHMHTGHRKSILLRVAPIISMIGNIGFSLAGLIVLTSCVIWVVGIESDYNRASVFGAFLVVWVAGLCVEGLDRRFGLLPRIISAIKKRDVRNLMTHGFGRAH